MVSDPLLRYYILAIVYTKTSETISWRSHQKDTGFFNAFMPRVILLSKKISKLLRNLNLYEDIKEENLTGEIQALINYLLTWSRDAERLFKLVREPVLQYVQKFNS